MQAHKANEISPLSSHAYVLYVNEPYNLVLSSKEKQKISQQGASEWSHPHFYMEKDNNVSE